MRNRKLFFIRRYYLRRVATVSEKSGKTEIFSRSGKSQRILHLVREIQNSAQSQGKVREICIILDIMSTKSQEQQKEIDNEKSILNL